MVLRFKNKKKMSGHANFISLHNSDGDKASNKKWASIYRLRHKTFPNLRVMFQILNHTEN